MLFLITGGSGSGKSEYAEQMVLKLQKTPRLYIATMYPFDEECHQRIKRHRCMRAEKGFDTLECYTGLKNADVSGYANELYQEGGAKEQCAEAILEGVRRVQAQCGHLLIVTNEIFSDGMVYEEETRNYQRHLGRINRQLAAMADVVVEVVCSIPVVHKGNPEDVR